MLQMKNVSKIYRTDTVETHALREFSLVVDEGEFVSVTAATYPNFRDSAFRGIPCRLEIETTGFATALPSSPAVALVCLPGREEICRDP